MFTFTRNFKGNFSMASHTGCTINILCVDTKNCKNRINIMIMIIVFYIHAHYMVSIIVHTYRILNMILSHQGNRNY